MQDHLKDRRGIGSSNIFCKRTGRTETKADIEIIFENSFWYIFHRRGSYYTLYGPVFDKKFSIPNVSLVPCITKCYIFVRDYVIKSRSIFQDFIHYNVLELLSSGFQNIIKDVYTKLILGLKHTVHTNGRCHEGRVFKYGVIRNKRLHAALMALIWISNEND